MLLGMSEEGGQEPKAQNLDLATAKHSLFPELNPMPAQPKKKTLVEDDEPFIDPRAKAPQQPVQEEIATPIEEVTASKTSLAIPKIRSNVGKYKIPIIVCVILLLCTATASILFSRSKDKPKTTTGSKDTSTAKPVSDNTIALYSAKNLPTGYKDNNDGKYLKTDVYYISITGPKEQIYYITQQLIPANFDFTAFNKKFLNPDTFTTGIGTAIAGPVGSIMLGSIRSNKNTWIIINAPANSTLANLESVMRSLSL
jgi:hypothetical protein